MSTKVANSESICRLLTFSVGERLFALPLSDVLEIAPIAELSCTPSSREGQGTAPVLSGFLNLAGTAVAVVNLARLVEAPDVTVQMHTPLIIVRTGGGQQIGLLVESVEQIAEVPRSSIFAMPAQSLTDSAVKMKEKVVPIISVDRLMLKEERERIAELQAAQQRRLRELDATLEGCAA